MLPMAFMKEPALGHTDLDILSNTIMDETALNDTCDLNKDKSKYMCMHFSAWQCPARIITCNSLIIHDGITKEMNVQSQNSADIYILFDRFSHLKSFRSLGFSSFVCLWDSHKTMVRTQLVYPVYTTPGNSTILWVGFLIEINFV